jgi:hypothetical protein
VVDGWTAQALEAAGAWLETKQRSGTRGSELQDSRGAQVGRSRDFWVVQIARIFQDRPGPCPYRRAWVISDKIGLNRAKVRVASDLSSDGLADIQHEQAMEKALGDQALRDFEVQLGLVTPETAKVTDAAKELGPAAKASVETG